MNKPRLILCCIGITMIAIGYQWPGTLASGICAGAGLLLAIGAYKP